MKRSIMLTLLLLNIVMGMAVSAVAADCADDVACGGVSTAEIEAYPKPNIQLAPNEGLLTDRTYRRVTNGIEIFDTPNGSAIDWLGDGFNFVTLLQETGDGWAEISTGWWVRTEYLSSTVAVSRFAGVKLPEESLLYPMGWILVNVYPSKAPGLEPSEENELLLRYTRVNLYAAVEIDGWHWYQVGVNQWVHQTQIAKAIPVERPAEVDTERWVSVDLYEQVVIAYENSTPVFATLASSGLPDWPTSEGMFHIYVRYPRTTMSGGFGGSDFYYLQEVPWTMYFNGDQGLHGTYWHDGFGYRHSHGCVNLSITDAYWLYNWASEEFDFTVSNDLGAAVYVYSSGQYE